MAVKIKLKRLGKIRSPQYRIIVADARTKRDGRAIEEIGKYHPKEDPSFIEVDSERAQYWLGVGAQPTEPVLKLLKITGDWQKFKGESGAEGTLKVREAKPNKKAVFEAAVKEAMKEDEATAATSKSKKKAEPKRKAEPKKAKTDKADAKTDAKADTKADAKADTKADAKADTKADAKADTKADTKTDAKADAKAETKSEAKSDVKTGKSGTKAKAEESKAEESKAEETTEAKSEA